MATIQKIQKLRTCVELCRVNFSKTRYRKVTLKSEGKINAPVLSKVSKVREQKERMNQFQEKSAYSLFQ